MRFSKLKRLVAVVALIAMYSPLSNAVPVTGYIVDTGVPTGVYVRAEDGAVIPNSSWALNSHYQPADIDYVVWLAGEFTLNSRSMLNSIEGFMNASEGTSGGVIRAVIYADGGDLPGTTLFSADFTGPTSTVYDWFGADGLHWVLPAETYWVGFEVVSANSFYGMLCCAPSPLANEAYYGFYNSLGWHPDDTADIGVRIVGRALPEPGTLALFGIGIAGLALIRRRKR